MNYERVYLVQVRYFSNEWHTLGVFRSRLGAYEVVSLWLVQWSDGEIENMTKCRGAYYQVHETRLSP
jgi:hypothetical protein